MPDFLLEIGLEEIPARMMDAASAELAQRVGDVLARESLFDETDPSAADRSKQLEVLQTPRRLAVRATGLSASQPDVTEQITGPSTKVAFKDGQPTPAAEAFAKKAGMDVSRLERVTNPKGEYLAATVTKKGRPAAEILA